MSPQTTAEELKPNFSSFFREFSLTEDTKSSKFVFRFFSCDGTSPAMSCAVFAESERVAIGWSDGSVQVLNAETLSEVNKLKSEADLPATSLSPYPQSQEKQLLLASYASGETKMWNVEDGTEIWKIVEDRQCLTNGFNCDHSKFAVSGSDAKINVYDTEDHSLEEILQGSMDPDIMDGHTMRVFALRFHPTQKNELVSGGWDKTVQFWDIREPYSKRKLRGPHICGEGIDFLDDNRIVTASWTKKNALQVWDYRNAKLIDTINPDSSPCFLYCCHYIQEDSVLLAGGSHDNMLRAIDMNTRRNLATFTELPGAVYFARELPKKNSPSYITRICFCSEASVYAAEVQS